MSHDDHATKNVEREDHGDHGDHGHPHGHAPMAWEIIPEGSGTDNLLIMLAFVALLGLFAFSGFMLTAPEHEEHAASSSADEMPSSEHGEVLEKPAAHH